jgi:hypothetical protein
MLAVIDLIDGAVVADADGSGVAADCFPAFFF